MATQKDWDAAYKAYADQLRSGDVDADFIRNLYGPLDNRGGAWDTFAERIINIHKELEGQRKYTGDQWYGGDIGKEDAAWDMAFRLAETGVDSLYDVGQRQVEQEVEGESGPIKVTDVEYFNKTTGEPLTNFNQKSGTFDTTYNLQFTPEGVPIAYTGNVDSDWVKFREGAKFLANTIGMFTPAAPYIAAANAANFAKKGEWEKAILAALPAAGQIAGQVGATADTVAAIRDANKYAKLAGALSSGKPEALLAAGAGFLPKDIYGHDPSMFNEGSFQYNQVFDPAEAGLVDLFDPSTAGYQFNTSAGGMEPDWSGYANLTGPELERLALGNFDQIDWSGYANLTEPELTELANQVSLNEAAAIASAQKSVDDRLAAAKNAGKSSQKPAQEPAASLVSMGAQSPIPLVVPENAADIKLMDEIFGTSLSAPSTGNETDRDEALARLLRS